jgi:hypothetical protein
MSTWIKLDTSRLNPEYRAEIGGVETTVRLSPHDIPLAVRAVKDVSAGRLIIEFKYLDDEPFELTPEGTLTLRVGRYSRRLFGVEVATPIGTDVLNKIKFEVVRWIDQWIRDIASKSTPETEAARGNLGAAKNAIESTAALLATA